MNWVVVGCLVVGVVVGVVACNRSAKEPPQGVEAVFVNAKSGETIARSRLALDQLPDSFLVETTMEIAGKPWSVVEAEPPSKTEFAATGKVTITVAPIEVMDPKELLFSLPTISDDLGQVVGDSLPSDDFLQLREDDWRQAEFVGSDLKPEIVEELADIDKNRSAATAEGFYKEIHVRKRLPKPLGNHEFTPDVIRKLMPPDKVLKGVSFVRQRGSIPRSFAWTSEGMRLWGITDEHGNVGLLCVVLPAGELTARRAEMIGAVASELGLIFVDWVTTETIPSLD